MGRAGSLADKTLNDHATRPVGAGYLPAGYLPAGFLPAVGAPGKRNPGKRCGTGQNVSVY